MRRSAVVCFLIFSCILSGDFARAQQSRDVNFVYRYPRGPCQDVWIDNNLAYISDGSIFRIIDVATPGSPSQVSELLLETQISSIVVQGDYAFVLHNAGLSIIDVSTPAAASETGSYDFWGSWAKTIAVRGDTVFVPYRQDIRMINVVDKANPVHVGSIQGLHEGNAVALQGNLMVVADNGQWMGTTSANAGARIFDITDLNNPVMEGFFPFDSFHRIGDITIAGSHIYLSCYREGLKIIDISTPTSPVLSTTYLNDPNDWIESVTFRNDTLFVANGGMLEVLDVTDPANPVKMGDTGASHIHKIKLAGTYAYLAEGFGGLGIVDFTDVSAPNYVGNFPVEDSPRSTFIDGDFLYVAKNNDGLVIFNVATPTSPIRLGQYDPPDHTESVFVLGNEAYIGGGDGLKIVDVTDRTADPLPLLGEYISNGNTIEDIYVAGDYAYAAFRGQWIDLQNYHVNGKLIIFDVTNKAAPDSIGMYVSLDEATSVSVSGDVVYLTTQGDHDGFDYQTGIFSILDVADRTNPVLMGSVTFNCGINEAAVMGNYAYIVTYQGIFSVDISDHYNPYIIGSYQSGWSSDIVLSGNYGYAAVGDGLRVLDLQYPSFPIDVGYYELVGGGEDVFFAAGNAYVAGYTNGLIVLNPTPQPVEYPVVWASEITVAEGAANITLRYGMQPDASDDIDNNIGEFELPPKPAPGTFDARFTGMLIGEGLDRDIRCSVQHDIEWVIDIQRAAGGNVMLNWPALGAIDGHFFLMDMADGALGIDVDMKDVTSYEITDNTIEQVRIIYNRFMHAEWMMNYPAGWSMASLGAKLQNHSLSRVFPGAMSAYGFNNGYYQAGLLHPGNGYWVNLSGAINETWDGYAIDDLVLELPPGWSMIGSISYPLPIASIGEDPGGSILSIYRFDGAYSQVTDNLYPGEGFWINLSAAANITLSSSAIPKRAAGLPLVEEFPYTLRLPVTIETSFGDRELSLYISSLTDLSDINNRFELPPLPPVAALDARFTDDEQKGYHSLALREGYEKECRIRLSVPTGSDKLMIRWDKNVLKPGMFFLNDGFGGVVFSDVDMAETDNLDLTGIPADNVLIMYRGGAQIIDDYELLPNYPNPFNPSTQIGYLVKESGRVRLVVYNVLGQVVKTLVDEVQPSGRYTMMWDGKDSRGIPVAGGMYICRLTVNDYTQTMKMVLIK